MAILLYTLWRCRPEFELQRCPICDGEPLVYQFTHSTTPIVRCARCGLMLRHPQPSENELAAIYTEQYFLVPGAEADRLKRGTAAGYLDEIEARLGPHRPANGSRPRLLELGSGLGNLLLEAWDRGYDVTGVEWFEEIEISTGWKDSEPRVHHPALPAIPGSSSDAARAADGSSAAWPLAPPSRAGRRQQHQRPSDRPHRLTVIVPVFNERSSFPIVMAGLLDKSIPNVDLDVVVIESNSTDGTREEVRKFEGHPRVKIRVPGNTQGQGPDVDSRVLQVPLRPAGKKSR